MQTRKLTPPSPLRRQYPQIHHSGVRGDRRSGPGQVQTASFVAIIGAAGLAIGLALQGSLSNFCRRFPCSSSSRPIKAGNSSRWQAPMALCNRCSSSPPPHLGDNKMVVVPNSAILQRHHRQLLAHGYRRVDVTLRHRLGSDPQAKQILERLVSEEPRILKEQAATIAAAALADSSVNIVVRPWVKTGDYWVSGLTSTRR